MADPGRPNIFEPDQEFDDSDPEGYRAGMSRPGRRLGAQSTGLSVYELPPGQSICPYHFEYAEEEWLVVVSGRPTLRTPQGESELAPGDVAFFTTGPDGAHKISNMTKENARVLMFSDVKQPAVSEYPDSGKVGVFVGERSRNLMVRRESDVDYYDGEA